MGNPATPSRACEPCRIKRRKCDFKAPNCSQCFRARINCPGYRDTFSLRIRNQTTAIARKVQARQGRDRAGTPTVEADYNLCTTSVTIAPRTNSSPAQQPVSDSALISSIVQDPTAECDCQNLHISVFPVHPEAMAINYYMNSHALVGSFNYLPVLYQTLDRSELLENALLAPALILLSQNVRLPRLQRLAYFYYSKAVWQTNGVLSNARLVTLDSTLLAVLLLGLFEALVFRGRQTPTGWNAHVQGSVALLRLRGPRQFESHLGRHLFLHASGNIMTSYAQMRIRTPPELQLLRNYFASLVDPNHFTLRLEAVLDGFADIRASIEGSSAFGRVQKALDLEDDIATIMGDLERHTPFEVVDATDLMAVVYAYHGRVYRYSSQRLARQWNVLRILKLFLNEQIYDLTSQYASEGLLIKEWSRLPESAMLRAAEAISDILYSVPFALELSESPSASARSLIYSLSGIAVSNLSSTSAIQFARNRLAFIGSQCGLVQATESVNMVLHSKNLEDWNHLSLLS